MIFPPKLRNSLGHMNKIIGPDNQVRYGVWETPIEFNHNDFRLLDFFGKEITGLRKRFAFHTFNYLGLLMEDSIVGIAAVSLGYAYNVFAYLYRFDEGKVYEFNTKGPDLGLALKFPVNPDEYQIQFRKGKSFLEIRKSHSEGILSLEADFEGKLKISGEFPYSLNTHNPLRVLNPSEPTRWTFTEKCSPLSPTRLSVRYLAKELVRDPNKSTLVYDWSGGYVRRETNWYWAAFSSVLPNKTKIGANFAALVNESFFSENAFWINAKQQRVDRCIFDFSQEDPYKPWRLWDEAGRLRLEFKPAGERREKMNLIFTKLYFRQFVGKFSGTFRPDQGKEISFKNVWGFTEFHRSLW
ncbi:PF10974 family protein [Leptospira broomii serovar Hurstbridge str. 5399]|uniref:PF10974 family protein n=2 Tax=Leptospira broomii TaxID=301541 RepID=T0FDV9_9LEPT|nr:PF10974 family protein [Leptospira broomii serovar Hurstbridge str. 5399]